MVDLSNVYAVYSNGTKALIDVNLHVDDGEFVFIIGPSGAGKSTIIKLLLREIVAKSGKIIANDYDLTKIKKNKIPYFRRTMGVIFQDFRLIPEMTVFDNIAFAVRAIGGSQKIVNKKVPIVLEVVGLTHKANNFPHELSAGEQQRIALARAIVNNPSLIIADEPTGNVDPRMSFDIMQLLLELNKRGVTIVVVTHDKNIVDACKKRVIKLENGRIVRDAREGTYYAD